jgi:hypothetical protein
MEVTYTLECLEEDQQVRGNAMCSGDAALDKETEDFILRELRAGNPWAWCCVKVTAQCGDYTGTDYLGCCSYRSEAEFREPGGFFDGMKAQAREDLIRHLRDLSNPRPDVDAAWMLAQLEG